MRGIEREASEPLPCPWRMAADEIRGVLAEREDARRGPRALRELSVHGGAVLLALDALGGLGFVGEVGEAVDGLWPRARAVVNVWSGLEELLEAGLLSVWWAFGEDGERAEVIVGLRYDVELEPSE
jgi:hypothetical protein